MKTSGNRGNRAVSGYRPGNARLNKPYNLCKIYEETKGCLDSFLELYRMIIESGMGIKEVTYTVKIANYNLPSVEWRYKILQNKVSDLEFRKESLEQENDKSRSDLQYYSSVIEGERTELQKLCQQTRNQESIVKYFRNNDPTFQNIQKSVEDKAIAIFSNSKSLLQKVATTLFHSMISDPNKCAELINCMGREGTKERIIQALSEEYLLPQPSLSEEERADLCISIIVEETDKLHGAMIRRQAQETLDSYFGNDGCPTFPRSVNSQ